MNLNNVTSMSRSDTVLRGDCIEVMRSMDRESIDLILTDPPYLVSYQSRDGRTIRNDADGRWLRPAFCEAYRVLRSNAFCISFYGWPHADKFIAAWRASGFRIVGHLVFRKTYASSVRLLRYQHELAYLLAKGSPNPPACPIPDVIDFRYTGNRLHPTEKPVLALMPLIEVFSQEGSLVFDPFCGSGSTLVATRKLHRRFLGIELDAQYHAIASRRLQREVA